MKTSRFLLLLCLVFISTTISLFAQVIDKTPFSFFRPYQVRCMAQQSDGKIIIGGGPFYDGIQVPYLIRINPDGSRDETFKFGLTGNQSPIGIQILPDDKIILTGVFDVNNTLKQVIKLQRDGAIDDSFALTADTGNSAYSPKLGADGKITMIIRYHTENTSTLLRFSSTGLVDQGFTMSTDLAGQVTCFAYQPDGKLLVAGNLTSFKGSPVSHLIRINTDGTLDNSFNAGTGPSTNYIQSIAIQSDGKIIAGGSFFSFNDVGANNTVRLNSDGAVDNSFYSESDIVPNRINPLADGKIILSGRSAYGDKGFARLNPDGSIDKALVTGNGSSDFVLEVLIHNDGKYTLGGLINEKTSLVRINNDFTIDNTLKPGAGPSIMPSIEDVLLLPENKSIILGSFHFFNGKTQNKILGLKSDFSIDETFVTGDGFKGITPTTGHVQKDGKIVIALSNTSGKYNGVTIPPLIRLNADGSLDNTLQAPTNMYPEKVSVLSDGSIIVAGEFNSFGFNVIKLSPSGVKDPAFAPKFDLGITACAIQEDDKIIIGGRFTKLNDKPVNKIIRLNPDGTLDNSFNCSLTGTINNIIYQKGGKILVGGSLTENPTSYGVVRLDKNGTIDPAFLNTTFQGFSASIVQMPDSNIVVNKNGTELFLTDKKGAVNNYFNRIKTSGTMEVKVLNAKSLLLLGDFEKIGDAPQTNFAIVTFPPVPEAPTELTATQMGLDVTLQWKDNSSNESAFQIEYTAPGIPVFQMLSETASNQTSLNTKQLAPGLHTYRVRAVNMTGFSPYSNVVESELIVSTEGIDPRQQNIYPNPTNDVVRLRFPDTINNKTDITVKNSLGQTILRKTSEGAESLINLSNFPSGVYFIDTNDQKVRRSFKVIKR